MKKAFNKFILIIFTLAIIFSSLIGTYSYFEYKKLKSKVEQYEIDKFEKLNFVENVNKDFVTEYEEINKIEKQPKDLDEIEITGWIPDWDYNDGFETLKQYNSQFSSVSPFWYAINSDGEIQKTNVYGDPNLVNYTAAQQIDLIPTITSFDAAIMAKVLKNEETIQAHINYIVNEVKTNDFDGIDLDYESIYLRDKEKFFTFLQKLSAEMIKIDRKLIFTVLPKWGDDVIYAGLEETRKVQDYKRIADLVDEFRIMTYDYIGRNPAVYGPNAPLQWMEDVIQYAILQGVPRDKIVLGIPTYSYDYSSRGELKNLDYYPVTKVGKGEKNAFAYYNKSVEEVKNAHPGENSFHEEWGEAIYKFQRDGEGRVLVYPTSESIQLRKQLAADYGIRGVAFWRLGDEAGLHL